MKIVGLILTFGGIVGLGWFGAQLSNPSTELAGLAHSTMRFVLSVASMILGNVFILMARVRTLETRLESAMQSTKASAV